VGTWRGKKRPRGKTMLEYAIWFYFEIKQTVKLNNSYKGPSPRSGTRLNAQEV
jgi:hypothetical protein